MTALANSEGVTIELSKWICPSIKPGHTKRPVISFSILPSYRPMPTILPSVIATSPTSMDSVNTFTMEAFFNTRSAFCVPFAVKIIFFMFFTFLLLFVVHNIAIIYVLKLPISQITTATYCLLCQQ